MLLFKKSVFLCVSVFLCGCSASMVYNPSTSVSQYAPINEKSRPGMVKYLNEGAAFVRQARRDAAYKQMYDSCGGKYSIVSEGVRAEGGVAVPMDTGVIYADSQYVYISFVCEVGDEGR